MDIELLKDPVKFKGLAYLDSHRGRKCRVKGYNRGYASEVVKHVPVGSIVPDRWYGTNCTQQTWLSSKHLRCHTFAIYHYLLTMPLPLHISVQEAGALLGSNKNYSVAVLSRESLVAATIYGGNCTVVHGVYETPQPYHVIYRAIRNNAIKLKDPKGKVHYLLYNLSKFARKHKVNETELYKLVSGDLKSYSGWTVV